MSEPKLLPCPFCGEAPSIALDGRQVWCSNIKCPVNPDAYSPDPNSAIARWNTRKESK